MAIDGIKESSTYSISVAGTSPAQNGSKPIFNGVNNSDTDFTGVQDLPKRNDEGFTIDNLYRDLCIELKEYKITTQDLKDKNFLLRATGISTEKDLEIFISHMESNEYQVFLKSLARGIQVSVTDGKIDFDKAANISNEIILARQAHISYDELQAHKNNGPTEQEIASYKKMGISDDYINKWVEENRHPSIFELLKATGQLPEDATLENTSQKTLKSLIEAFANEIIGKIQEKNPSEEQIRAQLKNFTFLLLDSSEKERQLFTGIIKELHEENRCDALSLIFRSLKSEEARQNVANHFSGDNLRDALSGMNKDTSIEFTRLMTKNSDENTLKTTAEANQQMQLEWLKTNKDKLQAIREKVALAEQNGTEIQLTEDEQKIINEYETLILGVKEGEILGTVNNHLCKAKDLIDHLDKLKANLEELGDDVYSTVLNDVHTYISTNGTNDELLQNVFGEDYKQICQNNATSEEDTVGYGFRQPVSTPPEPTRLEELKQVVQETSDENSESGLTIRKERETAPEETGFQSTPTSFTKEWRNAKTTRERNELITKYWNAEVRKNLENLASHASDTVGYINALPEKARKCIAQFSVNTGLIKKEDIEDLSLSENVKDLLENSANEVEEVNKK